jgi:protein kinase C substrate 80K-H
MNKKFHEILHEDYFHSNHQYTYVLRMSQYIRQRDNNDGGIVNIGYFSAWSGTTNAITMTYVHGDKCEKGRARSITVIFHCGNDNKIVAVRESTSCSYTMEFETPLVCNEIDVDDDDDEL